MRTTFAAAVVALGLTVAGCGGVDKGSHHYPSSIKKNFMTACTGAGGPHSSCTCALKHVEERATVGELEATEKAQHNGGSPPSWELEAARSCRGK